MNRNTIGGGNHGMSGGLGGGAGFGMGGFNVQGGSGQGGLMGGGVPIGSAGGDTIGLDGRGSNSSFQGGLGQNQSHAPGFSPSGNDQGGIGPGGAISNQAVGPNGSKTEDAAFDMSEFPSLSNRVAGMSLGGGDMEGLGILGQSGFSAMATAQTEFAMESEDFPALGGAPARGGAAKSAVAGGASSGVSPIVASAFAGGGGGMGGLGKGVVGKASKAGDKPPGEASSDADRFGLLGLLSVIRMTDPDVNILALGTDLTTLGLNLNSSECLYATFASPWADGPSTTEPQYTLPLCYYMQPPALKTSHLSKFQLETLFYIFYAMPKDILQAYSAQELYNREWRYHVDLKLWFKRATQADGVTNAAGIQYIYFDINAWERRLFAGSIHGGLNAGLLSEEEVRVKLAA